MVIILTLSGFFYLFNKIDNQDNKDDDQDYKEDDPYYNDENLFNDDLKVYEISIPDENIKVF